MNLLIEQISLGNQKRYGRHFEKVEIDYDQLQWIFNEAEVTIYIYGKALAV